MIRLRNISAILALLVAFTGCTDQLLSESSTQNGTNQATAPSVSKLRHGRMLPSASKVAGKDAGRTGVIIKLKPQKVIERYSVIERYAVLERYKVIERYAVLERYTYDHVFDGFAFTASTDALPELFAALSADPDIEWFEPDFTVSGRPFALGYQTEPDGGEVVPWSLERIGAVQQDKIDDLKEVVLFIVDTGVQHDDVDLKEEFDFALMDESNGVDSDGHGTHIAGIAAAEVNGKGLAGIAPKAMVYSLKVLGNETAEAIASDELDLSTAIAAVEYITQFKHQNQQVPVVANLSFGADVGDASYTALDEAIAASSAIGVTYVVSAGNDGVDASTYTPAHSAEAITVGAYDAIDRFASFSNYGTAVDILAPGVDILSLKSGEEKESTNFALMSGTSMAAAHVSGAVARFIAVNQQASPEQVREALIASSRETVTLAPDGTTNRTVYVGSGHLDGGTDGAGLMQQGIAPFRNYAVFGGSRLKIEGTAFIAHNNEDMNASVLTNGNIEFKTTASRISGFGYYKGSVDAEEASVVFQPAKNTMGLPSFSESSDDVIVTEFEPTAYESFATTRFPETLETSGTYDLGDGEVWYIDGNLKTVGPTEFTGTGIVIVKGSIEMKHAFSNRGGTAGFYAGGNIKVETKIGALIDLKGALYGDTVQFNNDVTFFGQITAINNFEIKEDYTLKMTYMRAPSKLTAPLWGN